MSKRKKILIIVGGAVALALIIFFSINATRKEEVLVQTSKAQRKDVLKSKVSASGEIRAKEQVNLQSEVTAIITELRVREGDAVKKGDVLLHLDPIQTRADTDATRAQFEASQADAHQQEFAIMSSEANLTSQRAALRSSKANVEQAESNYSKETNSFKRKQQLHEDGLLSREDYELAQNTAKAAKAQLEMAQAQLAQAETQVSVSENNIEQMKTAYKAAVSRMKSQAARLAQADDTLKKTILNSPLNGVITQLNKEKGERAVPGMLISPEATIMIIADLSVIQAQLKVDETDVISLALGQPAKIKVDALPDAVFDGEVSEIGNSPIATSSAATQEAKDFKVKVTLKDPSKKLRPGMSCTGDIITNTKQNVLAIPIQALTIREVQVDKDGKYKEPDLKKKKSDSVALADTGKEKDKAQKKELEGVFVIASDKVVRFRPVKTGITGESEIEILDNLKEGEEVVSGSFQTLRTIKDGASVKIDNSIKASTEKKS
jgi:HlyD family secretion protein